MFSSIQANINPARFFPVGTYNTLADLFTRGGINLINLAFFFIGLFFIYNLIAAAYQYVFSNGNPKSIESASARFLQGFFGITIVFASYIIVRLLISILNLNQGLIF